MAIQEALPDRLGPYRLLDRIGEGGMGFVHLATDSENRRVAVKVLRPHVAGDATARRRLTREVETMRRVHSPFVAEVIDADVTGDVPYIVTRFVAGHTLEETVTQYGPLRGTSLQRLAYGLAVALAAIHAADVVHRDLKPGNVMLVNGDPVVIDFGIAQTADTTRLTQTGMFMGTPGYLAPEVIEGQPGTPASDVHSWGTTVAFAARGEPPYGTGPYEAVFFRILRSDAKLDGIHGALYPLIAAALARDPAQRPAAAWLASQTARLDLAAAAPEPEPGTAAAHAPGAAAAVAPVTSIAASGTPAAAAEAGPAVIAASRVAPAPPAPVRLPRAEQPVPYQRPSEVADLLPPVRYAPPAGGDYGQRYRAGQGRAGPAPNGAGGRPAAATPRRHRSHTLAFLVIAVAAGLVLPVAGTIVVLAVIATLRAADRALGGIAARRSARGARATDALVVMLSAPWALARSVLTTFFVAPLLLFIASMAAVAAIIVMGAAQLPLAAAFAAGVFIALNCVGPGSRAPRRQLNRFLNALAPTRFMSAAATVVLGAFAAAMVSLALLKAPAFWPVTDPHGLLIHLPGMHLLRSGVQHLRHLGRVPAWKILIL